LPLRELPTINCQQTTTLREQPTNNRIRTNNKEHRTKNSSKHLIAGRKELPFKGQTFKGSRTICGN